MKTKLLILSIGVLLVFGIYIVLQSKTDKPIKSTRNQTILLINSILVDFDALEASEKENLIANFEPNAESNFINKQIATSLGQKTNNPWPLNGFDMSDGVFRDAWGIPLQFALTNSGVYNSLNPSIKDTSRPLVIWSDGPNRTNDLGFNDDLFVGR